MAANGKAADDGRVTDLANTVDDRLQEARDFGGYRKMLAGRYYSPPTGATSTGSNFAGEFFTWVSPMWIPHTVTLDRIAAEITTANPAAGAKLCLYDNDPATDLPKNLVSDYGAIDATTTGVKEITISETLSRGLHWFGIGAYGILSFRACSTTVPPVANGSPGVGGGNKPYNGYRRYALLGAWPTLPAAFSGNYYPHTSAPFIQVRAS